MRIKSIKHPWAKGKSLWRCLKRINEARTRYHTGCHIGIARIDDGRLHKALNLEDLS